MEKKFNFSLGRNAHYFLTRVFVQGELSGTREAAWLSKRQIQPEENQMHKFLMLFVFVALSTGVAFSQAPVLAPAGLLVCGVSPQAVNCTAPDGQFASCVGEPGQNQSCQITPARPFCPAPNDQVLFPVTDKFGDNAVWVFCIGKKGNLVFLGKLWHTQYPADQVLPTGPFGAYMYSQYGWLSNYFSYPGQSEPSRVDWLGVPSDAVIQLSGLPDGYNVLIANRPFDKAQQKLFVFGDGNYSSFRLPALDKSRQFLTGCITTATVGARAGLACLYSGDDGLFIREIQNNQGWFSWDKPIDFKLQNVVSITSVGPTLFALTHNTFPDNKIQFGSIVAITVDDQGQPSYETITHGLDVSHAGNLFDKHLMAASKDALYAVVSDNNYDYNRVPYAKYYYLLRVDLQTRTATKYGKFDSEPSAVAVTPVE